MTVRAVRGAIQIDGDDRQQILDGASELVRAMLERNGLTHDDLISIVFTATPDLTAEFPAYAARLMGMTDVPLLCASEITIGNNVLISSYVTITDHDSHSQKIELRKSDAVRSLTGMEKDWFEG